MSGRRLLLYVCFSRKLAGPKSLQIAAAETKNPQRNLPKAIKRIYIRILLFYIGGVFIVGLLVPSNDPRVQLGGSDASASPFVIAIERAGIKALPSIINAVLISAAWSAGSSDLYTSSRALCTFASFTALINSQRLC